MFCSAKQDRLFRDTWALEPILRQAAADYAAGVMPSMELIIELSHVQAKLQGEAHEFKQYVVVLCALVSFEACAKKLPTNLTAVYYDSA